MKQSINFYEFERAFKDMNRSNNFSYAGLRALFEYLEDYEEDTGEEVELDVIALCCEYSEYENIGEYLREYNSDIDRDDYEDEDEFNEAVKDEIRYKTQLIEIEGENGFIIQAF